MLLLPFILAVTSLATLPAQEAPLVKEEVDIHIPVVDMQDYFMPDKHEAFIDTLYHAMHEVGFFAVRNTGVDRKKIERAYDQAKKFFKQEKKFKENSFVKELHGQRGFVPGEIAKGSQAKDCKEFYHIGRELAASERQKLDIAPNVWANQLQFKEDMTSLYNELEQYLGFLFETIVEAVNHNATHKIPSDTFSRMTQEGDSLLRALYYPAIAKENIGNPAFFWGAAHTDIDLLAILPYATEKGLQVEVNSQWRTVVVPEDAFIINVGDMLENLTNGLFISARHRVIALEPDKERFSMIFFVHPPNNTSLAPLTSCIEQTGGIQRYAPGTRQEFLWERLLELNIGPTLLEPYSKTGHTERQMQFGRESPQVVNMLIETGLASQELLNVFSKRSD